MQKHHSAHVLQAEARREAQEAMASKRSSWFSGLGARIAQQVGSAAAGYSRGPGVAAAAESVDGERARVGHRRRSHRWNAGLEGQRVKSASGSLGGIAEPWKPIPLELSMVLSSSESSDDEPRL
jgi:hypothetical protein